MNPNNPQTPAPNRPGSTHLNQRSRVSATTEQTDRVIRMPEVCALTGVGKTSIYSIEDFPKRVQLSRRAVGWKLSQVLSWIESRSTVGA